MLKNFLAAVDVKCPKKAAGARIRANRRLESESISARRTKRDARCQNQVRHCSVARCGAGQGGIEGVSMGKAFGHADRTGLGLIGRALRFGWRVATAAARPPLGGLSRFPGQPCATLPQSVSHRSIEGHSIASFAFRLTTDPTIKWPLRRQSRQRGDLPAHPERDG